MRHVFPVLMLIWLGLATSAACATRASGDGPLVHDIKLRGNRAIPAREIKSKILTSEKPLWPFSPARPFDPADWQTDLRRIERLYEAHGYYAAEVARSAVVPRKRDGEVIKDVDLEVDIEEREPVRVAAIALTGLDSLPGDERDRLVAGLPVAQGGIFREADFTAAKRGLRTQLRDLGYATATVGGHAIVDVATHEARPELHAIPGERYLFGEVTVRAQTPSRVDPAWIVEQVRLAIGWDEPYSGEALEEAQKRVFAMNVFSTARVTAGTPDVDRRLIPVLVEVREGPAHTLRLGGGLGIDQIRQEARLIAEWTDRNFLGGLRRLSLRGLGGWAFIPSTFEVLRDTEREGARHGPIYRASADFEQPRLFGRPSLQGKVLLESERTMEQAFDAIGARAMMGVNWVPHSSLTVFPSYNLQGNWMTGPSTNVVLSAPLALGCQTDPCLVVLSYLEQVVTLDTRDSALEPRRGHYLAVSLQEGGGPLGGDFDYLRVLPEARAYRSFRDDRLTLAGRLRFGTLLTRSGRSEDSAVTTRFYSGGSLGMRGFAMRRLSPMLLVPLPGVDKNPDARLAVPIGGNGLVEGSFEARARFTDTVLIAGFTDFGAVTRDRLPFAELPRMQWAVGFGVRYLTPVGPLRLDLAFRLPVGRPPPLYNASGGNEAPQITYQRSTPGEMVGGTETGEHIAGGCFGIGARSNVWVRDGLCAFHLSIGEAF